MSVLIRNIEIDGAPFQDLKIDGGRIVGVGFDLGQADEELDGKGGALIPGLCDHHIHLLGLAARAVTVALEGVKGPDDLYVRIAAACAERPVGSWVRAMGYHESMAGDLTREDLDRLAPRHRLRIQHQTGALWMLNSAALDSVTGGGEPPGVERDEGRRFTGRIWREDAWLRSRVDSGPPSLAPVGRTLAAYGVTSVTDASVTTDASSAQLLADAQRSGDLPQNLMLMSGGPLEAPTDGAFTVGPLKVLLDDHALPEFDAFVAMINQARTWGRNVAVHCVTAVELALSLAAFEAAGCRKGDRIEHGSVIPRDAISRLLGLGLTVVTQSAFIRERGDRYAMEVDATERDDLYRCASLLAVGVPVAGSSDAPYASPDPWVGMAAAMDRRSALGVNLGLDEKLDARRALQLYTDHPRHPGTRRRRIAIGEPADLCLLKAPIYDAMASPSAELVRATFIRGQLHYLSSGG